MFWAIWCRAFHFRDWIAECSEDRGTVIRCLNCFREVLHMPGLHSKEPVHSVKVKNV